MAASLFILRKQPGKQLHRLLERFSNMLPNSYQDFPQKEIKLHNVLHLPPILQSNVMHFY